MSNHSNTPNKNNKPNSKRGQKRQRMSKIARAEAINQLTKKIRIEEKDSQHLAFLDNC